MSVKQEKGKMQQSIQSSMQACTAAGRSLTRRSPSSSIRLQRAASHRRSPAVQQAGLRGEDSRTTGAADDGIPLGYRCRGGREGGTQRTGSHTAQYIACTIRISYLYLVLASIVAVSGMHIMGLSGIRIRALSRVVWNTWNT